MDLRLQHVVATALGEADAGCVMKQLCDRSVYVQKFVILDRNSLIPILDTCEDPLIEIPARQSAQKIHDPSFWKSGAFFWVTWEVISQSLVTIDVLIDLTEA